LEAQSAGRLNHPNILAIYDTGIYRDFCYILMEYEEGATLKAHCHARNLLPVERTTETLFKVCNALDYAHQQGVIHRDIKPSNIMMAPDNTPKIMDFGIAQLSEQTTEGGLWGTPSYMSPEQLKEEPVTAQSDIFSLGCVLYELLTGTKAFGGENDFSIIYKITRENPKPILQVREGLPAIFNDIIRKSLAKNPKDRYPTCMDMAYDLRVALRGLRPAHEREKIQDVIDLVRHVPFFHNFTREQLHELGLASCIVKYSAGKVIVAEGDIDDTFYIILKGRVQIGKQGKPIALIGAGECFGEMAYIAGQARVATATAVTECALMKISATLLDKAPEAIQLQFFKNFARTLSYRLEKSAGLRSPSSAPGP
jgi:serine/threonine-protein kinase